MVGKTHLNCNTQKQQLTEKCHIKPNPGSVKNLKIWNKPSPNAKITLE